MMTLQNVMERLSGKWMVRELEEYLAEHFESFVEVQNLYISATEQLKNELDEDVSPAVDSMVDAVEQQIAAVLFFSGVLGIKANLDHFKNPIARTILDVDFDIFLQEDTARRLPAYAAAQGKIDSFYASLEPHQKELFEDVIEYISYMETYGPKLAHYFGYVLGNDILPCLVQGYHSDRVQTAQYRWMLTGYLGCSCSLLEE